MVNAKKSVTAEELGELTQKWWSTPVVNASGEPGWDEEVLAVNAMTDAIDALPEWALQVRSVMPQWGFEMCAHRWLDGLDNVINMIGKEEFWPFTAGWCGDVPGRIKEAAEQRAAAVAAWLGGGTLEGHGLQRQVAQWLGESTADKRETATCFVELVRTFFFPSPDDDRKDLVVGWRSRGEHNDVLASRFEEGGFAGLLQNTCGFKTIDYLDLHIRRIGGDTSPERDTRCLCNGQLRYVLRDDPERYDTTRGYLWGLHAYLHGRHETWLRSTVPECAGAAVYALQGVCRAGSPTPLRRWLVASLLKTTKIWCQRALSRMGDELVPGYASDLPRIPATGVA